MPSSGKPNVPKVACISGGWAIGINAQARNPDLAWKFMKMLHTKTRTAEWLAKTKKIAVRKDAVEVEAYAADKYLMETAKCCYSYGTVQVEDN
jgi:multiple sugar transport system substrate-binding protein